MIDSGFIAFLRHLLRHIPRASKLRDDVMPTWLHGGCLSSELLGGHIVCRWVPAPAHQIEIHNEIMRHFTFGAGAVLEPRWKKGENRIQMVIAFIVGNLQINILSNTSQQPLSDGNMETTSIALTRNKMWRNIMQFRVSSRAKSTIAFVTFYLFIVRRNETHRETFSAAEQWKTLIIQRAIAETLTMMLPLKMEERPRPNSGTMYGTA